MTKTVRKQILVVRETGLTNMFDARTVQHIAFEMNFFDLVCFIDEHLKEYVHFIITGEAPDDPEDGEI